MINEVNIRALEKSTIPLPKPVRGHKDFVCIEMISEDGTNFLQGLALIDIYKTKIGLCGKVNQIWLAPECQYNKEFGEALVENLEIYANNFCQRKFNDKLKIIFAQSSGEYKDFISEILEIKGFIKTSENRGIRYYSKEL